MMKWFTLIVMGCLVAGCAKQEELKPGAEMPAIYTVNYPLAYFAERIAGDNAVVIFPAMEGDPAFWEPTPEEVAAFQEADLILLNGAAYAKWVPKVSLPQSKMIDTSTTFKKQYIALDGAVNHTHGPGGAHAHGDLAFTTWLDPKLAIQQAAAVNAVLSADDLSNPSGFQTLEKDLAELDAGLKAAFAPFGDQPLLGSHPVYQYLERAYGLNMESVHWEPDAEPDAAMWRELEDILEAHDAKIMLWEGEPLEATKAKLAGKGIRSIVFDPCGNRPDEGDYLTVMEQNIANLMQ